MTKRTQGHRANIALHPRIYEQLRELSEENHSSMKAVVELGIFLLSEHDKAHEQKGHLLVAQPLAGSWAKPILELVVP
jgi:hypothetical protein